jgi:hypothetical protein
MFKRFREHVETVGFKERVPNAWRPTLRWFHRRIRTALEYHSVQSILVQNRELLRRQQRTDRCFIIGNGPSIKNQDLMLLRGETTFMVNSGFLHPDYERLDPTYHCAVDPLLVTDSASNLAWLRDLESRKVNTILFFPVDGHDLFKRKGLFTARNVYYVLYSEQGCDTGTITCDLARPVPGVACVTLSCLLIACYMGFREIYLLGCDHDWLGTPTVVNHFYDNNPYYSPSIAMYPYETLLESTLSLWRGYRRMRDFAFNRGLRIYNATRGGFLDVFPRVEYEKVVARRPGVDVSGGSVTSLSIGAGNPSAGSPDR